MKLVLDDTASGYNLAVINENFQKIANEFNDKILYRINPVGEANSMGQTLDMNGKSIINVGNLSPSGDLESLPADSVTVVPFGSIVSTDVQSALEEIVDLIGGDAGVVVNTFNTRSGDVTLLSLDVATALGYKPARVFTNIAALRVSTDLTDTTSTTSGYYTSGDGGGSNYYKDESDTTSADNGGTVIVDASGKRWKLAVGPVINVKQFGAKGNSTISSAGQDDTVFMQKFFTYLGTKGATGYIPAGRYRITSKITIAENCIVYGDGWKDVRDMTGPTTRSWASSASIGTIIYADYFQPFSDSLFYVTGNSCTIRDMEFEAKQNTITGGVWESANTPLAIYAYRGAFLEQGGNGLLLENIMIRNFKNGIKAEGASRITLDGIFGQCFGSGIDITKMYDVARINNIHLNWPFYSGDSNVLNYMNLNADAMVLGRVDNPVVSNFFVWGGRQGIKFYTDTGTDPGLEGGITQRFQGTNIGIDNIGTGIIVYDACRFSLSNFYVYCRDATNSRGIHTTQLLGGGHVPVDLNLTNGDFQGSQAEAMRFEVPGTVKLCNITMRDYDNSGSGSFPGIAAYDDVDVQYVNMSSEYVGVSPITQSFGSGTITGGGGGSGAVDSFNTRTGAVSLIGSDLVSALGVNGIPTMFRSTAIATPTTGVGVELSYDPAFTSGFLISYDRGSSVYKDLAINGRNITFNLGAAAIDSNGYMLIGYSSSTGSYKLQVNGAATFAGAVTIPTASPGDNTTKAASTAFVTAAIAATGSGASTFASTVRSTATVNFGSGTGIEMNYDVGLDAGFIVGYNRTTSTYKDINLTGRSVTFQSGVSGAVQGAFDINGYLLLGYASSVGSYKLQVNGDATVSGAAYAATASTGTTGTRIATCDYVINKIAASPPTITLSGDVSGSGAGSITTTLANSGVTAGAGYTRFTTDAKGRVTVAGAILSSDISTSLGYVPVNPANSTLSGITTASGTIRSTGTSTPVSGSSVEVNYDTGLTAGFVIAYDRSGSVYRDINIGGRNVTFKSGTGGTNAAAFDTNQSLLIGYASTNGAAYKLQVNSQIYATNATIATSDRRVKDNIVPLQTGMDIISKLQPVTFNFKEHKVHNFSKEVQVGFIAQDVEDALKDTIYTKSVVVTNEDGAENLKGLAETKLVPILVKALQELNAKFDAYVASHP